MWQYSGPVGPRRLAAIQPDDHFASGLVDDDLLRPPGPHTPNSAPPALRFSMVPNARPRAALNPYPCNPTGIREEPCEKSNTNYRLAQDTASCRADRFPLPVPCHRRPLPL